MEIQKTKIKEEILEQIEGSKKLSDKELLECIERKMTEIDKQKILSFEKRREIVTELFCSFRKYGVLQELMDDEEITEIMVNGAQNIFYEKKGRLYRYEKTFLDNEELLDLIQSICGESNRMVNEASPIVDTRLPDGSRVNIVLSPIALDGAAISIRRFSKTPMSMEQLLSYGSLTEEMAEFFKKLVQAGYNIFVSGGTGSGKTTFLNALSEFIPSDERIVTIEDSAELQLQGIPNIVRLETRQAGFAAVQPIEIRDLIRTALRMRPSRILVGECRGKEAIDLLTANNTGHAGSMGTAHANSCKDMLMRLETMVLMGMELPVSAIRGQIVSAIDILIHLGRLQDKSRKVLEVAELNGVENGEIRLNVLYRYCEESGKWEKTGELIHLEKWKAAGF